MSDLKLNKPTDRLTSFIDRLGPRKRAGIVAVVAGASALLGSFVARPEPSSRPYGIPKDAAPTLICSATFSPDQEPNFNEQQAQGFLTTALNTKLMMEYDYPGSISSHDTSEVFKQQHQTALVGAQLCITAYVEHISKNEDRYYFIQPPQLIAHRVAPSSAT